MSCLNTSLKPPARPSLLIKERAASLGRTRCLTGVTAVLHPAKTCSEGLAYTPVSSSYSTLCLVNARERVLRSSNDEGFQTLAWKAPGS